VKRAIRLDVVVALAATLLFVAMPQIDVAVSRLFMHDGRFTFNEVGLWKVVHRSIIHLPRVAFFSMISYLVVAPFARGARWTQWRRQVAYLAFVLALGPGIGVALLKDHWGRARPSQVLEAGHARFTPPLVPANECGRNCAFVSGHAAMGFYLMAVGFAFPRHRRAWLAAGLATGSAIGVLRLAQGAHFLSDIVFAGILTWFVAVALAALMRPSAASP
jgi:lipid A 4'-phosphatase